MFLFSNILPPARNLSIYVATCFHGGRLHSLKHKKTFILRDCSYLPKSTSAEKLEDLILVGHRVENFVLHQMVVPVALGIAAAAAVGRVGYLLAMRRHACLLAVLLLLLLLQLLLLLGMVLRHYSATHHIRVGGVDCQAVTITFPRPSFSL